MITLGVSASTIWIRGDNSVNSSVYISQGFPEKQNYMYLKGEKQNWLTWCGGWQVQNLLDKPVGEKFRQEWMLQSWAWIPRGRSGRLDRVFYVAILRPNCFLFRKPQSLLLSPSTDWVKPTHMIESNLLYSKSTNLNVNNIYKTFTATFRLVLDQTTGSHSLANLTHKTLSVGDESRGGEHDKSVILGWIPEKLNCANELPLPCRSGIINTDA